MNKYIYIFFPPSHFMILMSFSASLCSSFWCFHSGNYWYWPGFLAFLHQWKLTAGQIRNSGIRLYSGFCAGCRSEWKQITRSLVHLLPKWGTSLFLIRGDIRVCSRVRLEWSVGGLPLGGIQGARAARYFCSWLFRSGCWVFGLFVSFVQTLPQLHACSYF